MEGIYFLIPLGLVMGLVGLGAFLWSLRNGQYEDLQGAAERILFDDEDINSADRHEEEREHPADKNDDVPASKR